MCKFDDIQNLGVLEIDFCIFNIIAGHLIQNDFDHRLKLILFFTLDVRTLLLM